MTIVRRHLFSADTESLLLSTSALVLVERVDTFVKASGLDPENVFSSPLLAIPVPVTQSARWAGNASFLHSPLAWLPVTIAGRLQVRETRSGDPRPESDEEWAIRLALELEASGLYDPEAGWLDVLALHNLDLENPVDEARIIAWLTGEPDPTLDAIDLTEMFANDEPEWSFRSAQELLPVYQAAAWSLAAKSLVDELDLEGEGEDRARLVHVLAEIAWGMLAQVPARSESLPATEDELLDIHAAIAEPEANVAELESQLRAALENVRDDYDYAVELIRAS